jgi:DNA-binding NtrC family response regulator
MTHHVNAANSPIGEDRGCVNSAKKILVVDDDDDTRDILRLILERASFEVNEAANNNQALEKIQSWEPDLVTTDVGRPDGSGIDFLRLIKDRSPFLPVVVLTGQSQCRQTCITEGAAAFMEKPFEPKTLVEVVSNALSMTNTHQNLKSTEPHQSESIPSPQ